MARADAPHDVANGFPDRDDAAMAIQASVNTRASRLDVTTSIHQPFPLDRFAIATVLSESVPVEVALPYTVTVSERSVPIPVARYVDVDIRVFESATMWIGIGQVDDRWIELQSGSSLRPDEVTLHRIDDLAALPATRWDQ
jgi:hypothetical protein